MRASPASKAGWRLNEWLNDVGFGRSKFYSLPPELRPRSVNIAGLNLITEPPKDYLERIGKQTDKAAA